MVPTMVPEMSINKAASNGSSVDLFLAITGQKSGAVKGESKDEAHTGQIDISSWSWGMKRPTEHGGLNSGGLAVGAVELKVLTVTKKADSATCAMMAMLYNNDILTNFVLSARKPGGKSSIDFFKISLTNARLVFLDIVHGGDNLEITEQWTLGFNKIRIDYTEQGEDGGRRGGTRFEAPNS